MCLWLMLTGKSAYVYLDTWFFFSNRKTAYDMRISDWSSDFCSSDLVKARIESSRTMLAERARIYRSLQLPMLDPEAGKILREADRRRLLGSHLMVVGTNAMPAYHIEAGGAIRDVPEETLDFDLAWTAVPPADELSSVWMLLKAVDRTYTVNTERQFQARNAKAYAVEILAAPSTLDGMVQIGRAPYRESVCTNGE